MKSKLPHPAPVLHTKIPNSGTDSAVPLLHPINTVAPPIHNPENPFSHDTNL